MQSRDSLQIIQEIIKLSKEEYSNIKLSTYFIRRDVKKEDYYFSKSVEIDEPLTLFLKEHIIRTFKTLKQENLFNIKEYNQEFQLTDYIAKFDVNKDSTSSDEKSMQQKLTLLKKAMGKDKLEGIGKSMFQIIELTYNDTKVSFCFYKSVKKIAKSKRIGFFSSNEFKSLEKEFVEFGGKISFFIIDSYIYIIDPRHFEWAFDYKDHITRARKENLGRVTSMDFFNDEKTIDNFKNAANHHLLARGIANMKEETLSNVETHFNKRVKELKELKEKRDSLEGESRGKFEKEIGELNNLIKYIDFHSNTIIFKDEDDPKPLLHFFQDKIVESFLTKEIKVAMEIN